MKKSPLHVSCLHVSPNLLIRVHPRSSAAKFLPEMGVSISFDLICVKCRYNLRGLSFEGSCPECGRPIKSSALSPEPQPISREKATRLYREIIRLSGYELDAVMLTIDCVRDAMHQMRLRRANSMKAQDICNALKARVALCFPDQQAARDSLTAWRLKSSEDFGKILFAIV